MIYVNARFLTQEMTGVQRFAEQICLALQSVRDDVVFLSPANIKRIDTAQKLNVKVIGTRTGHLWEQIDLPRYLKKNDDPLLLNLGNTGPILYRNQIITQHDVTYKRFPQSYSWKFKVIYNALVPVLLRNAKSIITVSQFSKDEILKVYSFDKNDIDVIYNSASHYVKSDEKKERKERYFLAVSSANFHKNFHGLISEFLSISKNVDIKLKIIGGISKNFTSIDFDSLVKSDERIQFLGRVSDTELSELYTNAVAFVFPSFYEGFGIPPLEAQACGCPVVSSNMASMPEVLGNSALFFDPLVRGEMSAALELLEGDNELREKLIMLGYENIKRFSWDKSAKELSSIINRIK